MFRYEDLCTDPDALASSVAAFLSSGNPSSLPSRQPNLKCMLSNLVEPTWRAIVSRDEIARVLEKLEPWMVEFGYPATWEGIGETLDGKRKATAAAS